MAISVVGDGIDYVAGGHNLARRTDELAVGISGWGNEGQPARRRIRIQGVGERRDAAGGARQGQGDGGVDGVALICNAHAGFKSQGAVAVTIEFVACDGPAIRGVGQDVSGSLVAILAVAVAEAEVETRS